MIDFAELPGDGPVLDVGCGTGSLALELRRRFPDRCVSGVDVSAAYLAFARGRDGGGDIHFELADAARLPFEAGTFAGAIAQLALNFMPDPALAVLEMRRVTRPGGVVAAAVWDFCGGLVYQRLFWDTAGGDRPTGRAGRATACSPTRLPSPRAWRSLWQAIGLRDIEDRSLTIRMDYASFADYWEPLLGGQGPFGSYVAGLPERRRARHPRGRVRCLLLRCAGRPPLARRHRLGRARPRAVGPRGAPEYIRQSLAPEDHRHQSTWARMPAP